jgi:hypothetical protein
VGEGRHVRRVVRADQDTRVLVRQAVAALRGLGLGVLGLEQAGDGLLLEPLPRVALSDPRPVGELGVGGRAPLLERSIEPELSAEVDRVEL